MMQRKPIAQGGIVDYDPEFLPSIDADILFTFLMKTVPWVQHYYTNFRTGEKYPQPRQTAWYADDASMAYTYSGVTEQVQPWLPALLTLKEKIEKATQASYNSVLLNLYRNERDSVGAHADDEKELGTNANIASVSLGATRRFLLHLAKGQSEENFLEYNLTHGSLLVMSGTTQHYWKHEVPKESAKFKCGPRINLTFRKFFKA